MASDVPLIVVMAGGGADAYPMMKILFDALPKILENQPCVLAVVTGPFMPIDLIADLTGRSIGLPIHMMESVNDSLSHIAAADLVISMAGYNTTVEILRMKKTAILIHPVSGSKQAGTCTLFQAWTGTRDEDRWFFHAPICPYSAEESQLWRN